MVNIELTEQEIQAIEQLINDAQVPVELGFILGKLRRKIAVQYRKEQQDNLKKQMKEEE